MLDVGLDGTGVSIVRWMHRGMNSREGKAPETLAERFWSLARGMEGQYDSTEPVEVVEHVLEVLDALDAGKVGGDLSANTVNFLTLLRHYEVEGDLFYASPEQARGEQIDDRSLVFSVGVLLFEKLTGRHPFGAEGNPQRLARMQRGEMASGVNYFPKVPAELRVVLVRAMGPFPEERWSSLAALRAELEYFVARARSPGAYSYSYVARARRRNEVPGGAETGRRRRASPTPAQPKDAATEVPAATSMSGQLSAAQPEPEMEQVGMRRRPMRPRLPPGAWAFAGVLAGVLVTSLGFLASRPNHPAHPAASTTRTGMTIPDRTPNYPAPTPAPSAAPTPPPVPIPVPAPLAPGMLDPEAGGKVALAVVRRCVPGDRRVQFGASLVYDAASGRSRHVYFGAAEQLKPAERACLETNLLHLPAGGRPDRTAVVTYGFQLSPTGDQVRARLQLSP